MFIHQCFGCFFFLGGGHFSRFRNTSLAPLKISSAEQSACTALSPCRQAWPLLTCFFFFTLVMFPQKKIILYLYIHFPFLEGLETLHAPLRNKRMKISSQKEFWDPQSLLQKHIPIQSAHFNGSRATMSSMRRQGEQGLPSA